jgi:hypothetical protein
MRFQIIGVGAAIALSGLLSSQPAAAQDWNVVLNGKAIHVNSSKKWNEDNWGLGFEREFDDHSRWVKVALANGFLDSDSQMSYMAGGGIKRRFRLRALGSDTYVDLGAVGFLMTRQDVNDDKPFPGVLPALTVGTRDFAVNMTYMPAGIADRYTHVRNADPTISGILFIQFKLSPSMFGFGSRHTPLLASR